MPGVHAWHPRQANLLFPLRALLLSHAHLPHANSGLLMLVMFTSALSHHFSLVQPYFPTPIPLFRAESHKPWSSSPTSTRNASQILHMFTVRPGTSKSTDHDSIELTTFRSNLQLTRGRPNDVTSYTPPALCEHQNNKACVVTRDTRQSQDACLSLGQACEGM